MVAERSNGLRLSFPWHALTKADGRTILTGRWINFIVGWWAHKQCSLSSCPPKINLYNVDDIYHVYKISKR